MPDQKPIDQRILEDIRKTGYPTEVVTANTLNTLGWGAVLGTPYMDKNESKSRELDVRSYRNYGVRGDETEFRLDVFLLMECKKSSNPWVFFTTSSNSERDWLARTGQVLQSPGSSDYALFKNGSTGQLPAIRDIDWPTFSHYLSVQRWAHNYYEPFKGQERHEHSTQIFSAIQTVATATDHYLQAEAARNLSSSIMFPVIVFNGLLFEAFVRSDDDIDITEVNHVVFKHSTARDPANPRFRSGNPRTVLIDVVSSAYLSEYSSLLDNSMYTLTQLLRVAREERRLIIPYPKASPK